MTPLWSIPVVVAAFLTWFSGQPQSIGDAAWREALRRQLVGKSVRLYTNQDLPAGFAGPPVAGSTGGSGNDKKGDGESPRSTSSQAEQWWRERMVSLRENLERDELLAAAAQSRVNALTTTLVSRDDAFQQAQLRQQLQKAVVEFDRLEKLVLGDRQAIDAAQNEARRAGVPPGWLR